MGAGSVQKDESKERLCTDRVAITIAGSSKLVLPIFLSI
jgi:hypothetical protein